ncbi:MAG TPA: ATP-binding cassette domain-containing protein [Micromonosporaceae bacterium]|nr:ATP-binding cassette domain-containing protein [Micromonosporaceae bacterium]
MIRATGLVKSYGSVRVLGGVDLHAEQGSVLALLGPNGAGKTTTVRILSTLIKPDAGTATIAGHDILRAPKQVRAAISLTGQYAAVDELLTGEENLLMMGRLGRLGRAEARHRAAELLDQFDLADARKRLVRTYSGGMRRRLDLAISLITRPPVIFLDEPTTGLDPRSRQTMWQVIKELVAGGATILLTTQYLEEADQLADKVVMIDHGRVIAEGTAEALKSQLAAEQVELLFADEYAYAEAVRDLGELAVHIDRQRSSLRVATDGSAAQVRHLLNRLTERDVTVERIALHRPTLDDVFLALTGQPARSAAKEDA